jgi:3-phenylpropionate/trans-cinnamate dioxygenase ferredoxin reductase subunit
LSNEEAAAPAANIVVVGAGQAGGELVGALRQQGYAGRLQLIGEEAHAPYRRPPLSKAFLAGDVGVDSLQLKNPAAYEKAQVECRFGVRVAAIDRAARRLQLAGGGTIAYDRLALTTGGRVRRLALPGADRANVHYVRTIEDVLGLRERFKRGARLVIVGGGFIGLEVAAVAVKRGLQVTVLEALPRVLARVTAPEVSAFYEREHRAHGVDLRTGAGVAALAGAPEVNEVVLDSGERIAADLVVVGIGLIANAELAAQAGLGVANGIVVDQFCRTSDPDIVAAGDCTDHDNGFLGRRLRLESVQNALDQGRVAAATLCGKPQPYHVAPWFWSDQYDLKLQMVGVSQGYERVIVRGDPGARAFSVFYLRGSTLLAVDAINRPQDFLVAKRLVGERIAVDPERLADDTAPLKTLLDQAAVRGAASGVR